MTGLRSLLCCGLGAVLLTAGCAGQPPRDQFYRLAELPPPVQHARTPRPDTLEISRFSARELLEAERHILVREPGEAISWQPAALWVEPPARMIRRLVLQYLRGAGLFTQISSHEQQIVARYRLIATLLAFEQIPDANQVYVELDVSMVDLRERRLVFTRRYQVSEAAADTSVTAAVAAFSRAVAGLAAGIATDIDARLPLTQGTHHR